MEQKEEKKSRKLKLFVLLIVLALVVFGSFKLLSKPNEKSKGKEDKVETKQKTKKDLDPATVELQDALEGVRKLFDNGKPGTTRADITPEELKDVKEKIDKLEDSKVKEDLLSEYERIKKGPTSSSDVNQELNDGGQEQVFSE